MGAQGCVTEEPSLSPGLVEGRSEEVSRVLVQRLSLEFVTRAPACLQTWAGVSIFILSKKL